MGVKFVINSWTHFITFNGISIVTDPQGTKTRALSQGPEIAGITVGVILVIVAVIVLAAYSRKRFGSRALPPPSPSNV